MWPNNLPRWNYVLLQLPPDMLSRGHILHAKSLQRLSCDTCPVGFSTCEFGGCCPPGEFCDNTLKDCQSVSNTARPPAPGTFPVTGRLNKLGVQGSGDVSCHEGTYTIISDSNFPTNGLTTARLMASLHWGVAPTHFPNVRLAILWPAARFD
jgi:hypothetical protein